MTVPSCPIHKSPMKMGRDNKTFFCPRKDANSGEWCKEKATNPDTVPGPGAPAVTKAAPGASPKLLLLLGSLEAAARVYQGTGQGDDMTNLANELYRLNSMEDVS